MFNSKDFNRKKFFPYLIKKLNLKIGIEIGVLYGEFSFYLCGQLEKLYLVDCWNKSHKKKSPEEQKLKVKNKLKKYKNWEIIQSFSKDASYLFNDQTFDFIYIDAAHDYNSVKNDIFFWFPKLKNEGVLAGHDYNLSSVKSALNHHKFSINVLHGDKSDSWWNFKYCLNNKHFF